MHIYRFFEDCGRHGSLEGLFAATEEEVASLMGETAYMSEVLGKHSEIEITFGDDCIFLLESDPHIVDWFYTNIGSIGINPIHYLEQIEERKEEEE